MNEILKQILNYISALDWAYILTFIILVQALVSFKLFEKISSLIKLPISKRYTVLFVGFIYGIFLYFLRDYDTSKIECLLQSFVFALVFHKLLLDKLFQRLLPAQKQTK